MKIYGIFGAGGFGREVMSLLKTISPAEELVFVTENKTEQIINQSKVMSVEEFFSHPARDKYFNIAIAEPRVRKRLALLMMQRGAQPFSISGLNTLNLGHNEIDIGAILCPFTMVTVNAKIGKFFHANIYSYIAHDCIIGDYVTFAPSVQCNGGVIIEDEVYVGAGAKIKQSLPGKTIIIGKGAVLGMGAVVTKSVLPYQTVVGNPARVLECEVK